MIDIELFIGELKRKKISISVSDNRLKLNAPKGLLTQLLLNKINENREDIIEFLESAKSVSNNQLVKIAEKKKFYEASSAQKRMFILQQIDKEFTVYNIPFILELEGNIDFVKIHNSFNILINTHDIFRTYFRQINGDEQTRHNILFWILSVAS